MYAAPGVPVSAMSVSSVGLAVFTFVIVIGVPRGVMTLDMLMVYLWIVAPIVPPSSMYSPVAMMVK